jgi:hypothetical protein
VKAVAALEHAVQDGTSLSHQCPDEPTFTALKQARGNRYIYCGRRHRTSSTSDGERHGERSHSKRTISPPIASSLAGAGQESFLAAPWCCCGDRSNGEMLEFSQQSSPERNMRSNKRRGTGTPIVLPFSVASMAPFAAVARCPGISKTGSPRRAVQSDGNSRARPARRDGLDELSPYHIDGLCPEPI